MSPGALGITAGVPQLLHLSSTQSAGAGAGHLKAGWGLVLVLVSTVRPIAPVNPWFCPVEGEGPESTAQLQP